MDLRELLDLIAIRSYVVNSVANPIFDRKIVKELDGILILLDQKIASIITGAEFKSYIGFADVQKVIQTMRVSKERVTKDARDIMNSQSGIRR